MFPSVAVPAVVGALVSSLEVTLFERMLPFALASVVGALTGVSTAEGAGFSLVTVPAMVGVNFPVLAATPGGVLLVVLSAVFVPFLAGIVSRIPITAIVGASMHSIVQSQWAAELSVVLLWVFEMPFAGLAVACVEMFSWLAFPASVGTLHLWVGVLAVVVSCVAIPASALADVLSVVFSGVFVSVVTGAAVGVLT
ncbi:MAG: hypothetical protein KVP17_002045 [Porospora cf. gigantea B]|uniref:uncharacterized protein n=1 Tax=Porospora cf. gigantea B TaxID=2853592 RepID=UPI0035719E25|nr:MAG: hypothetical protein KVP17_002045 [Porospora cf. gigantea B]